MMQKINNIDELAAAIGQIENSNASQFAGLNLFNEPVMVIFMFSFLVSFICIIWLVSK